MSALSTTTLDIIGDASKLEATLARADSMVRSDAAVMAKQLRIPITVLPPVMPAMPRVNPIEIDMLKKAGVDPAYLAQLARTSGVKSPTLPAPDTTTGPYDLANAPIDINHDQLAQTNAAAEANRAKIAGDAQARAASQRAKLLSTDVDPTITNGRRVLEAISQEPNNRVTDVTENLREGWRTARSTAKGVTDEMGKQVGLSDRLTTNATQALLKGAGAAAIFTFISNKMNSFIDEAGAIQAKVASGEMTKGEAFQATSYSAAGNVPIIGGFFQAGQKVRSLFDGTAADEALAVATNQQMTAHLAQVKERSTAIRESILQSTSSATSMRRQARVLEMPEGYSRQLKEIEVASFDQFDEIEARRKAAEKQAKERHAGAAEMSELHRGFTAEQSALDRVTLAKKDNLFFASVISDVQARASAADALRNRQIQSQGFRVRETAAGGDDIKAARESAEEQRQQLRASLAPEMLRGPALAQDALRRRREGERAINAEMNAKIEQLQGDHKARLLAIDQDADDRRLRIAGNANELQLKQLRDSTTAQIVALRVKGGPENESLAAKLAADLPQAEADMKAQQDKDRLRSTREITANADAINLRLAGRNRDADRTLENAQYQQRRTDALNQVGGVADDNVRALDREHEARMKQIDREGGGGTLQDAAQSAFSLWSASSGADAAEGPAAKETAANTKKAADEAAKSATATGVMRDMMKEFISMPARYGRR